MIGPQRPFPQVSRNRPDLERRIARGCQSVARGSVIARRGARATLRLAGQLGRMERIVAAVAETRAAPSRTRETRCRRLRWSMWTPHADRGTHAAHDLADGLDERFVALRLADDHLDSTVLDRLDHPVGVRERDRERFFDNDVFRRACRRQDVLGVQVRRRRDIHRVDVRVRAQPLEAGVAAHRILLSESLDQIGTRVRRGQECGVRMNTPGSLCEPH